MALVSGRRGPVFGLALALAFGLAALLAPARVAAADIQIAIDEAKLVKLPERVATLVIGNPLIADASIQAGGLMVITGKGFGITNIIALDRSGAVLMEKTVEVVGPREELMVIYRGAVRETYSCSPVCEPRIMLGDGEKFFEAIIGQSANRSGMAAGNAPAKSDK